MRHVLWVILLFVVGSVQAATITIDFEELSDQTGNGPCTPGCSPIPATWSTQGFTIDGAAQPGADPTLFPGGVVAPRPGSGNDSNLALHAYGFLGDVTYTLIEDNGLPFNLESFSYTSQGIGSIPPSNPAPSALNLIGVLSGGGFVFQNLDTIAAYQNFTTVNFNSDWENLEGLAISIDGNGAALTWLEFDDIVVTIVPIPAAFWLFGSALAGLGWLRRKRTV